ncbi:MAG: hypothetical protein WC728_03365 [Elusimicrobiota bacterium]
MDTIVLSPTVQGLLPEPPGAHPRFINPKMTRCPICSARFGKPFSLNIAGGVVELKCPNASCGFTMPIVWTGVPAPTSVELDAIHVSVREAPAMNIHATGTKTDFFSESH